MRHAPAVRRASRACARAVALAVALASLGCSASSPHDRAWVGREIQRATRHAPGDPTRAPTLPPGVPQPEALREDDAVAVALWNSAAFGAELAQLDASQADLAEAGTLPNPTLSLLLPIGPRQLELTALAPISALIQRPYRVKAAKLDMERVARGLVQRGLDLARDARLAWIEVEAAKARAQARRDLATTWRDVARVARVRHEAGDAAEIEVATAEADATDALDQSERALTDLASSLARLRLMLGLAEVPLGKGLGTRSAPIDEEPPPEEAALLQLATASRPDVRAAELAIEAAGERLGWEKAKIFQLLGRLDVKPIGSMGGPPLLPLPGGQIEIPLFDWNPGGRGRAEAEMAASAHRYRLLKQTMVTDIRLARMQFVQALSSLRRFRETVLPLLERAAAISYESFKVGAEPYLVVLDATRRLRDARLRRIDLEAEVRRARAALERHVGRRPNVR